VYSWADESALGFASGSYTQKIKGLLDSYDSNLNFSDKLNLLWFSLKVNKKDINEFDLINAGFLKNVIFEDNTEGYTINKTFAQQNLLLFSQKHFSGEAKRILFKDSTQNPRVAIVFSDIFAVIGTKLSAIEKGSAEHIDCRVAGRDEKLVYYFSRLFDCDMLENQDREWDLVIYAGRDFAARF
jgi:hypothetical protein